MKRFTDSESSAEFYRAVADFQSAHSMSMIFEDAESEAVLDTARDRMFTTEQFALLPHFDEVTA